MGEEVVFSCCGGVGSSGVKIAVWEPSKGAVKRTYSCEAHEGGAALAVLGKTYLLCALKSLPFIYVWHLRKEQVYMKIACPGVVQTLATTPNAVYCAAAIAEKIHIWEVSTGRLLAVASQHYQPVSTLVFSDDGLWLVSGGDDGRVIVWSLRRILSESLDTSGVSLPHCGHVPVAVGSHPPAVHQLWSDHALPVTGVCCGAGDGLGARVATASLDQTCKLYDMASGRLLCSLLFGFSLTAVTMDTTEQWLFVGGATGKIAQVNLFLQRTSPAHGMSAGIQSEDQFQGHMQAIRSLAVCSSGSSVVSSSEDGTCRVWDIASGQTIRVQQFKGPVVHSVLCWDTPIPGASKKKGCGRDISIAPFQKQLAYSREGGGLEEVKIRLHRTMDPLADLATLDCEAGLSIGYLSSSSHEVEGEGDTEVMDDHRLREDLTRLREINRKLYSLLAEKSPPSQKPTSSPLHC